MAVAAEPSPQIGLPFNEVDLRTEFVQRPGGRDARNAAPEDDDIQLINTLKPVYFSKYTGLIGLNQAILHRETFRLL